jgi:phosphopantothenoylcysteine synthetase/decarboxylase
MCKHKIIIINHNMKFFLDIFLFTCTPIEHNNKTFFMENCKTKMWTKIIQKRQIQILKMKWV